MEKLTSTKNRNVKLWRKLLTKKGRKEHKLFLVEGLHDVEEALKSDWEIDSVIIYEDFKYLNRFLRYSIKKFIINEKILRFISKTESPQGIFAVVNIKKNLFNLGLKRFVILDRIKDPGNLGTIIRTVDASAFDAIIMDRESVDPFNPKVIRSSEGSIFHVSLLRVDILKMMKKLKEDGAKIIGTSPKAEKVYTDVKIRGKVGVVFGNESRGVREEVLSMCDEVVKIPIYGRAESLNVSVSAGIILYHLSEQIYGGSYERSS